MAKVFVIVFNKLAQAEFLILYPNPEPGRSAEPYVVTGNIEDGESPDVAAAREVTEETGLHALRVINLEQTITYQDAIDGKEYTEYCYAVEVADRNITLNEEHVDYAWVSKETFIQTIWWEGDRKLLQKLVQI